MSDGRLELDQRIDRGAAAFEQALRKGTAPALEAWFQQQPELGPAYRWELLATELEYRASQFVTIDWLDYRERFPDEVPRLVELQAQLEDRYPPESVETIPPDDSVVVESPPDSIHAPLDLGDYILERRLGKGGQGEVHLARQRSLDRPVAIKLLHAHGNEDAVAVRRFLREARTLAQTRHPQIVTIHGIGTQPDGGYFLVMEYVDGADLAAQLRERPFAPHEAARIITLIATAVEHAHQRGVIHRDLKPSNVLWDAVRGPVVTDFGLAKDLRAEEELTYTEQVMGTPGYMAPEQASRKFGAISQRTDVYGLGATLFALLTGRPPFAGGSVGDVLGQVLSDPAPDVRTLRGDVPEGLCAVCARALAKFPTERYASAKEFIEHLERWRTGLPIPKPAPLATTVRELQTGTQFGKYRLLEQLSPDVTRRVYRAENEQGRTVLLKVLPAEWLPDRTRRSQFRQEALLSSRLAHPCLSKLLEAGTIDKSEFVALEYCDGESAAQLLAHYGPFDQRHALEMLEPIAQALQLIHEAGIVYRDLRPQNLLLDASGQPMLAEVRFSNELGEQDNATMSGWGPVTTQYLAPELILGQPSTVASDVYTLGATLYALVTGRAPFEDATDGLSAMIQKNQGTYTDPRKVAPDLDAALVELIRVSLEPIPARRLATAAEFACRLGEIRHRLDPPAAAVAATPSVKDKEFLWDDNVQFTVYRPKAVRPETWERLLAFAHLSDLPPDAAPDAADPVAEVRRQAEQVLGAQAAQFQSLTADAGQAIPREGELTFVPSGDGLEFNPPARTFRWLEPVHREEFRFRAAARLDGQQARGRLSVFYGSLLIAEVGIVLRVDRQTNLAEAQKVARQNSAYRFRRIYACVAPADEEVAAQFRRYAEAIQDTFLVAQLDRRRSGFGAAQQELIKSADQFQLYWSRAALESAELEQEWRYALSLRRGAFIRPLYWQEPFPTDRGLPPPELLELGFQKIPVAEPPPAPELPAAPPATKKRKTSAGKSVNEKLQRVRTARSAPPQARLEILSGPQQGFVLRLEKERITIGRHPGCDLMLESSAVSRYQTQLVRQDEAWFVEDLQSRNGSFLNGMRVNGRAALKHGDQLQIGNVIIAFWMEGAGAAHDEFDRDIGLSDSLAPVSSTIPTQPHSAPLPPPIVSSPLPPQEIPADQETLAAYIREELDSNDPFEAGLNAPREWGDSVAGAPADDADSADELRLDAPAEQTLSPVPPPPSPPASAPSAPPVERLPPPRAAAPSGSWQQSPAAKSSVGPAVAVALVILLALAWGLWTLFQ